MVVVQRGRYITFDPEPANKPDPDRVATLRLDGNGLRTVKKGNVFTRFDGALSDRETGRGNWSSSWDSAGSGRRTRRSETTARPHGASFFASSFSATHRLCFTG